MLVKSSHSASGEAFALSVRTYLERPARPPLVAVGAARELWIERYEAQFALVNAQPITGPTPVLLEAPINHEPQTTRIAAAEFNISMANGGAATIIVAGNVTIAGVNATFSLFSAMKYPCFVHGLAADVPGNQPHLDERKTWCLRGSYLVGRPDPIAGQTQGPLRLYWTRGNLTVQTENGERTYESKVWDEQAPANPRVTIRRSVWHEIRAEQAILDFQYAPPTQEDPEASVKGLDNVKAVWFAEKIGFLGAKQFAVDSNTHFNGTLPDTSGIDGSSLWVNGNMTIALQAQSAESSRTASYSARVEGSATAYSIGGKRAIPITPPLALGALTLAGLLAAALLVFRETLGQLLRGLTPLYSKLQQGRLLDNQVRELLVNAIRSQPGIHVAGLHALTASGQNKRPLARSTVTHHLRHLERFGVVRSRRAGLYLKQYYLADAPRQAATPGTHLLRSPIAAQVALAILASPGLPGLEIRAAVNKTNPVSKQTIHFHLTRLEREGLIVSTTTGRRRGYEPTSALAEAMQQRATSAPPTRSAPT